MVKLLTLIFAILFCSSLFGQTAKQKETIKKASDLKTTLALVEHAKASNILQANKKLMAKQLNAFTANIPNQKKYIWEGFYSHNMPRFKSVLDTFAVNTMWANKLQAPYAGAGPIVTGTGYTIAQWDEGKVKKHHEKFNGGRITNFEPDTVFVGTHGTLVASSMVADNGTGASGDALRVRGVAPNAKLHVWDYTNENVKIVQATAGTIGAGPYLVSNHSYGENAGWIPFMGDWYWLGDTTQTALEDEKFGWYSNLSAGLDTLTHANPYYLMCWASGNSRLFNYTGPHKVWGATIMDWVNSTTVRAPLGLGTVNGDGFDCILTHQTAKNILTVGSIETIQNAVGYVNAAGVNLSGYSSAGPTDDGRIKPDVVAPGDGIRSASVNSADTSATNYYVTTWGTSNSSPNAAASAILMQQYYNQTHSGAHMFSATLKALIIHTAHETNTPGPDYRTGYGIVNPKGAIDLIAEDNPSSKKIIENTLNNTNVVKYNVTADGTMPLKVTIAWNDVPGAEISGAASFDNSTSNLINDLDIVLKDNLGNIVMRPYILNPLSPATPATTGINSKDNVEQIMLASPTISGLYTIEVSHKGTLYNGASQSYGLIISGTLGVILPLQVLQFKAEGLVQTNKLSWQIENQSNGITYFVEKANESGIFITIGQVAGTIANSGITNYGFNDDVIAKGAIYYRLRIVKPSGQIIYSNTAKIVRGNIDLVQVFPNPASNIIYLNIPPQASNDISIKVFDAIGKLVYAKQENIAASNNLIKIDCKNWPKGYYIIYGKGAATFSKNILIQ